MVDEEEAALLPRANEDARVKTKVWNDASPLEAIERIEPKPLCFGASLMASNPPSRSKGGITFYYVNTYNVSVLPFLID